MFDIVCYCIWSLATPICPVASGFNERNSCNFHPSTIDTTVNHCDIKKTYADEYAQPIVVVVVVVVVAVVSFCYGKALARRLLSTTITEQRV